MTARRKTQQPEEEEEPVASTDTHTSPNAPEPSSVAPEGVSEYSMPDGTTYLLTAADAEARGAKAIGKPANKSVTPSNK